MPGPAGEARPKFGRFRFRVNRAVPVERPPRSSVSSEGGAHGRVCGRRPGATRALSAAPAAGAAARSRSSRNNGARRRAWAT
jgi:hypothetical protein